ncbi:hypothetical protein OGAPHI_007251 [Ogataea philodendri]|uniref:Ubiquitin-activating enzyme E1-like n=3 Tax=Saccharomycotina TaxID=147537 RepID=A0A9P8SZ55_9ASCO|nr:uncharacterized protein OGAPHI_007251 [Ogataea philodendri]KAH3660046.1 hypothetical protein OGAPHI_007251 [Ogataea philodendri]
MYDSYLSRIFGDQADKFRESKVLMVGAGGIGCELLKDLLLMNYGEIHILDLDTIDLSNLNRQFLFRQKDIKQSKALTAQKAVESFNHNSKLVAHHGNIMDTNMFPLSFFKQFNIIFNALDNLEARFYVNKIALFTKIPLIESGTSGLKGQVQPIYPYQTECFACIPKEQPKSFPVCTIRSTPSKPIHCITWAKNFLFPQLFGEDASEQDKLKPQDVDSDNKAEIEALLKESNELLDLKALVMNAVPEDDSYVYKIIAKIFKDDIERLLLIETLWTTREKPTPLEFEETKAQTFDGQRLWTAAENVAVFVDSTHKIAQRLKTGPVDFDKDDEDTLDFVVSAANLRSHVFHIPLKTKFEIKQIAGNIIPAVATTNAIMAGFSALSSIHAFYNTVEEKVKHSKMVYDSNQPARFVNSSGLAPRNNRCPACSVTRGIITLDLSQLTVNDIREAIIAKYGYSDDIGIADGSRLLYDYDFDDNLETSLDKVCAYGDVLFITDADEELDSLELFIDRGDALELPAFTLPKAVKNTDTPEDEDDEDDFALEGEVIDLDGPKRKAEDEKEPAAKKRKLDASAEIEIVEL